MSTSDGFVMTGDVYVYSAESRDVAASTASPEGRFTCTGDVLCFRADSSGRLVSCRTGANLADDD